MVERQRYYPREEEFIDRLIPYMAPAGLAFVAAAAGFLPPDFTRPFRFVDLGCGRARSLLVLARLYPHAEFWGIDFNEKSIAYARNKARELGLSNCTFLNEPFEKLEVLDLPEFDFVSMCGLYTWLTSSAREAVRRFVKNRLRKGGGLYLEFAALPGAGPAGVFWRFVRELIPPDLTDQEKIARALEFFEIFTQRPTRYLMEHPKVLAVIQNYLRERETQGRHLLHNVLPEQAFPLYFFEIYDEFRETGVEFVGRLELAQNDPELGLFPAHVPTWLRFRQEVRLRETLVDFVLNIGEHHDLWLKEPERDPEAARSFLAERFFLLPRQAPGRLRRVLALPGGHRFHLSGELYDPFFRGDEGPVRLEDHPAYGKNPEAVVRAFYRVAASGEFFIGGNEKDLIPTEDCGEELPERFSLAPENRYLLAQAVELLSGCLLVSPVTGGPAVSLDPLEAQVLWWALQEGRDRATEAALAHLQSEGVKDRYLRFRGERRRAREIRREDLERVASELFRHRRAFNLQRLNIVLK